jgi:hypothetical protein
MQIAVRHADPRTPRSTTAAERNFDRHGAYVVVAFVAGG